MYVQKLPHARAEIASDGTYVWVNIDDLMHARFGPRGFEVLTSGRSPVLDYLTEPGPATPESWVRWVELVETLCKVGVGDDHRPTAIGGTVRSGRAEVLVRGEWVPATPIEPAPPWGRIALNASAIALLAAVVTAIGLWFVSGGAL